MNDQELKVAMLDLLVAVDMRGAELRPDHQDGMTNGKQLVVALLIGSVRLTRAIWMLLSSDMADEARILTRTLIEHATTLAYLHHHQDDLEPVALRLMWSSLHQLRGLELEAESEGLRRPTRAMEEVNEDIDTVRRLASEAGISRLPKTPSINAMLKELDSTRFYWFHKYLGHDVHGSLRGLATRLEWTDDTVTVKMRSDIAASLQVGWLAAENLLTVLIAAAHLLDWGDETVQELGRFRSQVRPLLTELVRRGATAR